MNWAVLILSPILGAAFIAGIALLIARLLKGPLETVAESSDLTGSENNLLFPRWSVWLYVLTYLGFLLSHFIWNRSFESPDQNWPIFATIIILGIVGLGRYSRVLNSSRPGKFRRVTLLMISACATAAIVGVIALILIGNQQKPKPQKASIPAPASARIESPQSSSLPCLSTFRPASPS